MLENRGGRHICPKCGTEYKGQPYEGAFISRFHEKNLSAISTLGLAYAFTKEETFARKAREILIAYAQKYQSYQLHGINESEWAKEHGARIFAQSLDEAFYMIKAVWGYDLIYNSSCLADKDKEQIESDLFRPAFLVIKEGPSGITSWRAWCNAAMAVIGFCLEEEDMVSFAINNKMGIKFQLDNSVLSDGIWKAGTMSYHFYGLDALRIALEAYYFAGIDLYKHPNYKAMYDAPIFYAMPDGWIPAINDGDIFPLTGTNPGEDYAYEIAYARFGDPIYLNAMRHKNRGSLNALLWGVDELPDAVPVRLESKNFSGLGVAILRNGSSLQSSYLHFDYGPFQGHKDCLGIILYALGVIQAPDPGRLSYSAKLHNQYYKETIAHNTLCVDSMSQKKADAELTMFGSTPIFQLAQAKSGSLYENVFLKRTLVLADYYLVDIFEADSNDNHIYDWAYHNFGDMKPLLATKAIDYQLGSGDGYQHISNIREAITEDIWQVDFCQPNANVRLTMLAEPNTTLYFGSGFADKPPKICPMVIARRNLKKTVFVTLIEFYADSPKVKTFQKIDGPENAMSLRIKTGDNEDILILSNSDRITGNYNEFEMRGRACFIRNPKNSLSKPLMFVID